MVLFVFAEVVGNPDGNVQASLNKQMEPRGF